MTTTPPRPTHSQSLDSAFDLEISELQSRFQTGDICERLALNRLRHACARKRELESISDELHPAASADPEVRRAYNVADRDFWRALSYLQRRLDHHARLAERKANPTPAYAATLLKPDPAPVTQQPAPKPIAPANKQLASTWLEPSQGVSYLAVSAARQPAEQPNTNGHTPRSKTGIF